MLRIIIADDHPLLVDGVKSVLEEMDEVQVLEPATNGRQLIDRLQRHLADIVLLDLNMPQMDGITTLKFLQEHLPQVQVIVFTNYSQPRLIKEVRALGARGFLLKTSNSTTLKEAVSAVAAGDTWFPDQLSESPDSNDLLVDDFVKKYQITKREIEIIRMIAQGLTTRQIGEQLFVSEFTINAHRRNIARKLSIDTPVGLLNFAKEQGLI